MGANEWPPLSSILCQVNYSLQCQSNWFMSSFTLSIHRSLGLPLLLKFPSNLACSALCGIRSIVIISTWYHSFSFSYRNSPIRQILSKNNSAFMVIASKFNWINIDIEAFRISFVVFSWPMSKLSSLEKNENKRQRPRQACTTLTSSTLS